jgi:hypothetical protein
MFDTKIAVIIRDDLLSWQALNVTAFLITGIVGQFPDVIGEPYRDKTGNVYNALSAHRSSFCPPIQQRLRQPQTRAGARGEDLALC